MSIESNPVVLKVQNGTRSDKRLCDTCHFATILRGAAVGDERVFCAQLAGNSGAQLIPTLVVECNRYSDRRMPSLYDMREMAWELRTTGKRIGFVSPDDRKREDREPRPPAVGF